MDLLIQRNPERFKNKEVIEVIEEPVKTTKKNIESYYEYDPELSEVENYIQEALNTEKLTVNKLRKMTKNLLEY